MMTKDQHKTDVREMDVEKLIDQAIRKVHAKKENDLCKYLPGTSGGYIHHFTLKKMKGTNPGKFSSLIKEFILDVQQPTALPPKKRAPRGSKKRKEFVTFSRLELEKVLEMARKNGDVEFLTKFSPKRPLQILKRDLIRSIRRDEIFEDLWQSYVETIRGKEITV